MEAVKKIRQKFCNHEYPLYYSPTYDEDWGSVIFTRTCSKCRKVESFRMPLDNVEPVWWKLQTIRKHYYIH